MDPVEINAGAWYLRALRDDQRITDVPALSHLVPSPADYVRAADRGWAAESSFTWAVCEPTTGELIAVVVALTIGDGTARIDGMSVPGTDPDARVHGVSAATRFVTDGVGLTVIA